MIGKILIHNEFKDIGISVLSNYGNKFNGLYILLSSENTIVLDVFSNLEIKNIEDYVIVDSVEQARRVIKLRRLRCVK